MNIRQAKQTDYNGISSLVTEFFNESVGHFIYKLDPASILRSFKIMVERYIVTIAIKDDVIIGVIAGTIAPCDFNYEVIIATEIIWYVKKEHRNTMVGVKLFKEFETESANRGATHIAMSYMENLHPEKLQIFYKDKGYKKMQTQYIRSLK